MGSIPRPVLTDVRGTEMQLDGVDVFIGWGKLSADELGQQLERVAGPEFNLVIVTNPGQKVYPGGFPETFCTDHWRNRFQAPDGAHPTHTW